MLGLRDMPIIISHEHCLDTLLYNNKGEKRLINMVAFLGCAYGTGFAIDNSKLG